MGGSQSSEAIEGDDKGEDSWLFEAKDKKVKFVDEFKKVYDINKTIEWWCLPVNKSGVYYLQFNNILIQSDFELQSDKSMKVRFTQISPVEKLGKKMNVEIRYTANPPYIANLKSERCSEVCVVSRDRMSDFKH